MRWKYLLNISLIIILAVRNSQSSTAIECAYRTFPYAVLNNIYECNTNNNPNISTQDSALISSIKGVHEFSRANDDVTGFRAQTKTIQFFPVGLEKHFKNLKLIYLESCPVNQLRQSDLKEYTNLEYLCVFGSQISIIEAGTFDQNAELKYLNLGNNKLIHIDQNAFKNLNKVTHFYLHSVPCINMYVSSRTEVVKMYSHLETKCKNPAFLSMHQKFKNLEYQPKNAEFMENLEVFEREFKASAFSNNPSFKTRLDELKSAEIYASEAQLSEKIGENQELCEKCSCPNVTQDLKVENLSEDLEPLKIQNAEQIDEIKSLLNDHDSKLSNIQETITSLQESMNSSTNDINKKISELKTFQENSQDNVINSLSDIKVTISDVDSSLSKIKSSHNDLQSSINKLRLAQNEIGIAVDKIGSKEECDGKIDGFSDFEAKTNEKFEEIKQDLATSRHKLALNFDEKIRGIEKRLMKKFEDLENKLVKILDEKLGSIIDAKMGAK